MNEKMNSAVCFHFATPMNTRASLDTKIENRNAN